MTTTINFWKEQLHEIKITTVNGRILRLYIEQNNSGFCLSGEFYEIDDKAWYLVEFSKTRVNNATPLFKECLESLNKAMNKKNDKLKSIHNTCNAPIVSETNQDNIVKSLGLNISVTVN